MTRRWFVLALMLIAAPAQAQTVLWFSGHEQGGISGAGQYEGLSDCTVVHHNANVNCTYIASLPANGSTPYSGAYLIRATTGSCGDIAYCQVSGLFAVTTIYMRFMLNIPAGGTPTTNSAYLLYFANAGETHSINLRLTTGKVLVAHLDNAAAFATGTTVLSAADNTWYLIETKVVVNSATVSGMELKINGATEFSTFNQDGSGLASVAHVKFGQLITTGSANVNYDDVMMCSGTYCPQGRTLARQGTTGTPTYDAWTKSTCTSSLIENCWASTPYSATANASNAVAADAQTMFVHDFGTTQTGHGTEIAAISSIVNACKVIMVAKSGTASAPISIRRRILGVNTDVAKTLTTADAGYDDGGTWGTGISVLRDSTQMEIGVVHGTGVATDTVEDMWLTCDIRSAGIRHRVTQ